MLEDVREHPATWTLAAAWVLMFLVMEGVTQVARARERDPALRARMAVVGPGALSIEVTHLFGDLSFREIREGQFWRALTATFIHYSFFHLLMNVFGLIQLGRLIEPWYGSGPFLFLCLVLGTLGNLIGSLARFFLVQLRAVLEASAYWKSLPKPVLNWFGPLSSADVHAAGGSTILLGLMGIALVVGIRSKTRIGAYLADQMWTLLGFTALIGLIMPGVVDNFGHGGGAAAGILLGFLHRPLIRWAERPRYVWSGWAATIVLLAVGYTALTRQGMSEIRLRQVQLQAQAVGDRLREVNEAFVLIEALRPVYEAIEARVAATVLSDGGGPGPLEVVSPTNPAPPADPKQAKKATPPPNPNRLAIDASFGQALNALDPRIRRLKLDPETAALWDSLLAQSRKVMGGQIDYKTAYAMLADYRELRRAIAARREAADAEARGASIGAIGP